MYIILKNIVKIKMLIRFAIYDPHAIPRHQKLSFEPCRKRYQL